MNILHTPLGQCIDVLGGAPYRIGDFRIHKHDQGFECVSGRLGEVTFLMPRDVTLIDAQRYVTIFNAGFLAGAKKSASEATKGSHCGRCVVTKVR